MEDLENCQTIKPNFNTSYNQKNLLNKTNFPLPLKISVQYNFLISLVMMSIGKKMF